MELAYFSLNKRETTNRVVEEMKQHFMQDKGEKMSVCCFINLNNLFQSCNKTISCQLQFQYISALLNGVLPPAGNIN